MGTLEQFLPAFLEEVVGDRFGRYSKYIIQDRAIPDVRDGLKPVQRRILYAMYEAGNTPDKPYRKSAKTVGDVMGNYHPHGDASIYEGMVRMAQPWKMGHVLIDGHGNWGSVDDDPPAAMRYTEARLSPIAMEMMRDIDKRTVPFKDNFDNTAKEPVVLPSRFPNLLVNGVSGISSGFATEIPPHNLREVIDACIALMDDPDMPLEKLLGIVKGPDFPTGGIIMGEEGIREAYRTGKGRIYIRAKTDIEDLRGGRKQIVITEIPYQVVKSRLVTAMETIRLEKKVDGIAEVRDESGRNGQRIVVELKKDADAEGILAYLLKKTDLQITYNFNMVAIVNKAPRQLGLKEMLTAYINHQKEVVSGRSRYELEKAEDRAHVLEGLVKALNILDDVIATIKASKNRQDAQQNLVAKFGFTERQADAILTLQLYRLTNLEITQLTKELRETEKRIAYLKSILASEKKLLGVIKEELSEIRDTYGVDRRSDIRGEVEGAEGRPRSDGRVRRRAGDAVAGRLHQADEPAVLHPVRRRSRQFRRQGRRYHPPRAGSEHAGSAAAVHAEGLVFPPAGSPDSGVQMEGQRNGAGQRRADPEGRRHRRHRSGSGFRAGGSVAPVRDEARPGEADRAERVSDDPHGADRRGEAGGRRRSGAGAPEHRHAAAPACHEARDEHPLRRVGSQFDGTRRRRRARHHAERER